MFKGGHRCSWSTSAAGETAKPRNYNEFSYCLGWDAELQFNKLSVVLICTSLRGRNNVTDVCSIGGDTIGSSCHFYGHLSGGATAPSGESQGILRSGNCRTFSGGCRIAAGCSTGDRPARLSCWRSAGARACCPRFLLPTLRVVTRVELPLLDPRLEPFSLGLLGVWLGGGINVDRLAKQRRKLPGSGLASGLFRAAQQSQPNRGVYAAATPPRRRPNRLRSCRRACE